MSFKQAAFEIRFSPTDSRLEVYEIQPDQKSKENVPEPFKKRDKIPRSSGSIDFTNGSNSNNSNSNNNSSNSNHSISNTAAPRHSSTDSQAPIRSRHHPNGDNLNGRMSSNSDQVSPLKVKSSNSVGPEADKQLQRLSGGKNLNIERSNSLGNDVNASEDDSIIRNPHTSNKKQRSLKVDDISGEKEKGNLSKVIPNHNHIMDSNGKSEMVHPNKIMQKTIIKNKKLSALSNNNNKDDDNKSIPPKDGIATPPDTPPRSPARSPQTPSTVRQKRSDNDITDQLLLEQIQLATPPLSSSSNDDDVSTQSSSRVIQSSRASRKRRGSHSSQFSSEMPAAKLQVPRSRRLSSATSSKPMVAAEQSKEPFTSQLSNKSKEVKEKEIQNSQQSQQSQPTQPTQPTVPPKSRIPRLSMSSRERPVIAKKESHGSISLSSQGSNKFNESKESLSLSPGTSKRGLRSATSRPIINTSFITDVEVESGSPTSYSPTNDSPISYSSASRSPTSQSPTSQSPPSISSTNHSVPQKKLTISHDDVIVPTVAKKLKMNGQLHFVNHDALLGYSEEPESISPSSENGYMDITDQVVDLFDSPRNKSHKKKSLPDSQRRPKQSSRKNSHSRNSSKTHYVAPRKQNNQPAQQTEDSSSPMITEPEKPSNPPTFNEDKRRKSRREEYIMVIRDDDDIEFIEPPVPSIPSEPIIKAPAVQVESNDDQIYQEKIVEPEPVQEPVVQYEQYDQYNNNQYDQYNNNQYDQYNNNNQYDQYNQYNQYDQYKEFNAIPAESTTETTTDPIVTSGKIKKDRKKKQKRSDLDDDEVVKRSTCRCSIM